MEFIASGREQGAKVQLGGERWGNEGYFIQPTIFTETKADMRIVQEEIFGPVGVVIRFEDDDDVALGVLSSLPPLSTNHIPCVSARGGSGSGVGVGVGSGLPLLGDAPPVGEPVGVSLIDGLAPRSK